MKSIKNFLVLSARQRKLCKQLHVDRNRLYRMAFAWSHNADITDEVVQETMIKALNNIDKVKNIEALDGWLFRVLLNCFYDVCRKRRKDIDIDDIALFDDNTPETIHSQNEMLTSVKLAIEKLPLKHRQVLTLVDVESFSYAEVAEIVDAPLGTIMSRLNRARQSLKQILEDLHNNNRANLKVVTGDRH